MKRLALCLLLFAGCTGTSASSRKCPEMPTCLTAPNCIVDESGCRVCQCSPAYDDWRNQPVDRSPPK